MVSDHQPVQEDSEVGSAAALATVAVGSEEEEVSEVDMAAVAGMAGEAESATDMADQEALPQVREVVGTEAVEGGTAVEEAAAAAAAATMTVDRATPTMSLCHLVVEAAIVTAMGDLGVAMAAGKRGRMMVVGMTIRGPGSDDTSRRHQVVRPPTEE